MNEISLTDQELGSLLGDDNTVTTDATSKDEMSVFKDSLSRAIGTVKSSFSEGLGQETEVALGSIEELNAISADGATQWYVAKGNFTNNGNCDYAIVFPDSMAHEFAKQFTGVADLENSVEQVADPLKELSNKIVSSIVSGFENNFSGSIENFQLISDLTQVGLDGTFLRVAMSVGGNSFYQFFNKDILTMLSPKEEQAEKSSESVDTEKASAVEANVFGDGADKKEDSATTLDIADINDIAQSSSSEADADFSSLAGGDSKQSSNANDGGNETVDTPDDIFSSMGSLGESLLSDDGSSSISNVEFSEFSQEDASDVQSSEVKKIDMLMDVSVDVVVELGHTKRSIAEVLDLSRGSILDLNKLAGEPLDIKVNNKLVAKGEVVVIDENFGVRIVEIVSPQVGTVVR